MSDFDGFEDVPLPQRRKKTRKVKEVPKEVPKSHAEEPKKSSHKKYVAPPPPVDQSPRDCPCGLKAIYQSDCRTWQCMTCKRFYLPKTEEWIVEMDYEKEIFGPLRAKGILPPLKKD